MTLMRKLHKVLLMTKSWGYKKFYLFNRINLTVAGCDVKWRQVLISFIYYGDLKHKLKLNTIHPKSLIKKHKNFLVYNKAFWPLWLFNCHKILFMTSTDLITVERSCMCHDPGDPSHGVSVEKGKNKNYAKNMDSKLELYKALR